MPNNNSIKNNGAGNQGLIPFSLKKGDVFLIKDSNGETLTHRAIKLGQAIVLDKHPSIVHGGIALSANRSVEMSANGIGMFSPNHMDGQKVIVFRFNDHDVSDLAADLAYNLEKSFANERLKDLKKYAKKPTDNNSPDKIKEETDKLEYSIKKAILSGLNTDRVLGENQKKRLEKLIQDFDFKNSEGINNKLYCTELVVMLFYMSHLILSKEPEEMPMQCNLHYTDPSQLFSHLNNRPGWEQFELEIIRDENNEVQLMQKAPVVLDEDIIKSIASLHYSDHEDVINLVKFSGIFTQPSPLPRREEKPNVAPRLGNG